MGYLHEGHLSLVRRARQENERLAASVFVNPRQFGPSEDFARYPRDLDRDWKLLRDAGCDLLFAPSAEEMFPAGSETGVEAGSVAAPLEGAARSGHFRGVATVVLKLFGIFTPTRAYFGQKDAQQTVVVRRMAADLDFDVEIVVCPTVREADGLAMSSRNAYLTPDDRRAAPVLFRALQAASAAFAAGQHDADGLRRVLRETLDQEPRANTQYVSVADPETLDELGGEVRRALVSMAVFVGKTRLIDNVLVDRADS
jgi:pantoate--beta-alanine ligase